MEIVEIRVTGRVQGVGFRYFTMNEAMALGIKGWVKNMPDGSVLLRARGNPEQMENFRAKLRQGPIYGKVEGLEVTEIEEETFPDFRITY